MKEVKLRFGWKAYEDEAGNLVSRECTRCGENKPAEDFYAQKRRGLYGKKPHCKSCEKARVAKYERENKEKSNLRKSEWDKEFNVEGRRLITLRYRARKRSLPDDFTKEQRLQVEQRFGGEGICALTGLAANVHFDHVIPTVTGHGGTTMGNMVPMTGTLNQSKNDSNVFEWFRGNKERLGLSQERFNSVIEYLAELNGMTVFEYTSYVYLCHENKIKGEV